LQVHSSSQPPPHPSIQAPATVSWHTPPRNNVNDSIIPDINTKLLSDASDTELDSDDNGNDIIENDSGSESEDFVFTSRGWFCKLTKTYLKVHPYASNNQ
jgi:hypothetical protein